MNDDLNNGSSIRAESIDDGRCDKFSRVGTEERARVYGLEDGHLLDKNIVIGPGKHVVLSSANAKEGEPGLARLRPTDIEDVKRWIGVPNDLAAKRGCCAPAPAMVPGAASLSEFRKLDPQARLAVHMLAEEYVQGDSRRVSNYKPLLDHLVDRSFLAGLFLRQDIEIHRGAVLELGRDLKILFARHIRIYRGGLLKFNGAAKVDCVTLTGNLIALSDLVSEWLPSFATLKTVGVDHD